MPDHHDGDGDEDENGDKDEYDQSFSWELVRIWGGWAWENIKMFTEHNLQLIHSPINMDVETEKLGGVVWSGF